MPEKVQKLGLKIDPRLMYLVNDGWVWTVKRAGGGKSPPKPVRLAKGNFDADDAYVYFVDADGDVSRVERVEQKHRSTTARRKPPPPSPERRSHSGAARKGPTSGTVWYQWALVRVTGARGPDAIVALDQQRPLRRG